MENKIAAERKRVQLKGRNESSSEKGKLSSTERKKVSATERKKKSLTARKKRKFQ